MTPFLMNQETAAAYVDLPVAAFINYYQEYLDVVVMNDSDMYRKDDIEFVTNFFFRQHRQTPADELGLHIVD